MQNYFMIAKILGKGIACARQPFFLFCKNKDYFQNKKLRQMQKTKIAFKHDESRLKQICLNMKQLSPNFFARTLPIKESEKIIMPNKEANAIDNSYVTVELPLSTDKSMKNSLQRLNSNEVRLGRILQCMDSIAGIVGYRHCFGSLTTKNPFILVTGSVSSINLFEPIFLDKDVKMEGYVNYVGKSSMEIQINLYQQNILKANALFTMISRNAQDPSKSYTCPKLIVDQLPQAEKQKAIQRFKQSQINFQKRKKQMAESYFLKPPSPQDINVIHNIFLNTTERQKQGVDTEKTIITNTRLMHIQQRNVHNKIFGGFLMRQMVETGWITATQFALNQDLRMEDVTNVYFKAPVEIGSHLRVRGRVSYTRGNIMIVTMEALTYKFHNVIEQKRCCELHMVFKCAKQQKKIVPKTYENALHYLTSRNLFHSAFPSIKEI